jgi:ABC-type amino acid transport substrate-binding protein
LYPKNWHLGKLKSEIHSSKKLAVPFVAIHEGINLLINNRADALLSPTTNALYAFKKMNLTNQFVMNSPQLESLPQYLMFSKNSVSDEIYQRINSAMSEIVEAGEMDEITKSYTHSE